MKLSLPKRIANRFKKVIFSPVSIYKQVISNKKIKQTTNTIKERKQNLDAKYQQKTIDQLSQRIAIFLSYKVTNTDRLNILSKVSQQLFLGLELSGLSIYVVDSSDNQYLEKTQEMLKTKNMEVFLKTSQKPLCQAYLDMLESSNHKYFYLQFDDQLTVGLNADFLEASCNLLDKYEDLVNVVCIMWPFKVNIKSQEKIVDVKAFQVRNSQSTQKYLFGIGKPQTPIIKEKIGAYEFGIFENFQYGFFFNHLIAPVKDYKARLKWYMENVSQTSVHSIELAASERTVGPFWTHIAICLSDICLLDLDYSHTPESIRPEEKKAQLIYEGLCQDYDIISSQKEYK